MPKDTARDLLASWDGQLPVQPERIATANRISLIPDPSLARGEIAVGHVVKFRPDARSEIVRENITEGIAHIALGHTHTGRSGLFDYQPHEFHFMRDSVAEIEAGRLVRELLVPDEYLERLIYGTDAPKDEVYLASRFGITPRTLRQTLIEREHDWVLRYRKVKAG